mmetsp:Transcript_46810/g.77508  ORF Transcript_46810/g.77508 Transcript_46810/m.77508 type:complete len:218 (-) Transcript_46810:570-1223(-)
MSHSVSVGVATHSHAGLRKRTLLPLPIASSRVSNRRLRAHTLDLKNYTRSLSALKAPRRQQQTVNASTFHLLVGRNSTSTTAVVIFLVLPALFHDRELNKHHTSQKRRAIVSRRCLRKSDDHVREVSETATITTGPHKRRRGLKAAVGRINIDSEGLVAKAGRAAVAAAALRGAIINFKCVHKLARPVVSLEFTSATARGTAHTRHFFGVCDLPARS